MQFGGQPLGPLFVEFNDLGFVFVFDGFGETAADIAAAADHHPLDRFVEPAQFAHDAADVFLGGNEKYFVACLDNGIAGRNHRAVLPENCRHPRIDVGDVLADVLQFLAHQRAAVESAYRHQADASFGEFQHLQRLRKLDQLGDIVGEHLFRTDHRVHRKILRRKHLRVRQVIGRADARDLGRDVEHRRRQFAGNEIGFIALGDRKDHVGVAGAGALQHLGVPGIADDGAQIEAVLQFAQPAGIGIDHGDVVGF